MEQQLLSLLNIEPFSFLGISCCIFCGTIIGLERQLSGKPAGIRTSILICFSTYLFAVLSSFLVADSGDPSRVVGQIVTGVGFLGGGVMLSRNGLVVGITSAAIIWLLAGLGCIIAFGFLSQSVIFSVVTVLLLIGISFLEKMIRKLKSGEHKDVKGS
ncbi:MAG: MgtC/SapB family protein [Flavobacteriales bacterium]|nr:MgtC/SapB family protein [Flavobacteriales bacterium]